MPSKIDLVLKNQNFRPWPTSNRLVRHLREKHIPKAGSDFYPTQKGK
jgi:hypothetical protein